MTIAALASELLMDRTTMGRALRPLEREGFVAIGPGRDGRTRALSVTPAGKQRLKEALPLWRGAQRVFEARYGSSEAADLRASLRRLVAAV